MVTWKTLISYIVITAFAILFLFVGNTLVAPEQPDSVDTVGQSAEARVERIIGEYVDFFDWGATTTIRFEAQITSGEFQNETVIASQSLDDFFGSINRGVREGDRVILNAFSYESWDIYGDYGWDVQDGYELGFADDYHWYFSDFIRINQIIILGLLFALLLLVLGKMKGLKALLTLGFTCIAVFAVFIPSILSGRNIYLSAIIVCAYSIIVTILLINGVNKKSLAAISGCLGGVIAAAALTLVMNYTLELTGIVSGESMQLLSFNPDNPIDLQALIFASIIIGAVGAVMDVAVSISSALWELKAQAPDLTLKKVYKSGMNIGRDVMASMTNTLVLAYIGSSLSIILLLVINVDSLTVLFNSELVIIELLQAIIGSMGILVTVPLTALICAALLSPRPRR